ncbi:MAG: hypothetical protein HYS34_11930 [Acidobacteria bacterium]|nr:hypothetical protein [Acidobacteriota bacterium]
MPPDRPPRARPIPAALAIRGSLSVAAAVLVLAAWLPACRSRADDPATAMLARVLHRGDRLILLRTLDPEATRIAAVVDTAAGKPELRIYEGGGGGQNYAVAHTAQQGDAFKDLALIDVDLDGQEEVVVTWEGGHLEAVEVIARGQDGAYRAIFQNAGRQIEKRYDPAGRVEFWITSRTYEEGPGQAPAYETTVYRLDKGQYAESPGR